MKHRYFAVLLTSSLRRIPRPHYYKNSASRQHPFLFTSRYHDEYSEILVAVLHAPQTPGDGMTPKFSTAIAQALLCLALVHRHKMYWDAHAFLSTSIFLSPIKNVRSLAHA